MPLRRDRQFESGFLQQRVLCEPHPLAAETARLRPVPAVRQEDAMGIRDRNVIGVDNLLWGSDYPHVESTFPRSRQIIEEVLKDCTEEEKAKIAGGNAARIYRLN